jgi:hypothetical protein
VTMNVAQAARELLGMCLEEEERNFEWYTQTVLGALCMAYLSRPKPRVPSKKCQSQAVLKQ